MKKNVKSTISFYRLLIEHSQRLDRALVDAVPVVGRYCWETVIVLER